MCRMPGLASAEVVVVEWAVSEEVWAGRVVGGVVVEERGVVGQRIAVHRR